MSERPESVVVTLPLPAISTILDLCQSAASERGTPRPAPEWPYGQLAEDIRRTLERSTHGLALHGMACTVALRLTEATALRDWCERTAVKLLDEDEPRPMDARTLKAAGEVLSEELRKKGHT